MTVIVTDPAGNSSTPVTAEAPDFPDAPQVNASNGGVLSGTAEAGVTIVITDGNGNPIGQTSADASGNWSFTPGSQLPDGTVVNVVARDAAGNSSPATSITVDGVAPSAPVVEPSNGSELSGTAEPGSSVTLTDGNGNPIGQTTADANGNWSFTPSTPLPDGPWSTWWPGMPPATAVRRPALPWMPSRRPRPPSIRATVRPQRHRRPA
ncbi:Ig-like domain-containing protein [Pseudomonas aeruginosa]|nr:Ig-like domain-containing protein [Pseudomonas aeruginosa]